jgi:hypothetical protein
MDEIDQEKTEGHQCDEEKPNRSEDRDESTDLRLKKTKKICKSFSVTERKTSDGRIDRSST